MAFIFGCPTVIGGPSLIRASIWNHCRPLRPLAVQADSRVCVVIPVLFVFRGRFSPGAHGKILGAVASCPWCSLVQALYEMLNRTIRVEV